MIFNVKQDVFSYLHHLRKVQESKVRFLAEDDSSVLATQPPAPVEDSPPEEGTVDPNQELPGISQEATADIQKGAITLEMVIEKFNAIRSGRSFKEKNIKQQMMQYFDKLTDEEKVALYAFLKGISQIVTGEFTGYNPVSPSDIGAPAPAPEVPSETENATADAAPPETVQQSTSTTQPTTQQTAPSPVKKVIKTVKPNIIRRQAAPTNPNAGNEAAPIPITPKVR